MYWFECGDKHKPLMVLLHGGGVAGWMWKYQAEFFKNDYHILIPDLPGHGRSADLPFVSIKSCADEVIDKIIHTANENNTVVCGLSLGGQIAVEIISRVDSNVSNAIIQSALVIPMPEILSRTLPMLHMCFSLIKNKTFAKLQAKQLYIPKEMFENYFEDSKRMSEENLINIMKSNLTYALPEGYKNSKCNIMIICGSREINCIKKSTALMLSSNAHANGFIAKGIGHGVSLKNADLFNSSLIEWLKNKNPIVL
jgi:pimeloyl-ACP methyl ester carboxylesterase